MVYIQIVMTAGKKATKLGHDKVTRLEACLLSFCRYSTIFQLKCSHKRWQTKPKVMTSVDTNYSLFYLLRRRRSTPVLRGIICPRQITRPHQNCTKSGFQDNLSGFNSFNRNVCMVACRPNFRV